MTHAGRRLALATAILLALEAPQASGASEGTEPRPSSEALLAHGLEHFESRSMREGLGELEEAVAASPDWTLARRALAGALIRAGRFEEARAHLVRISGGSLVTALESGEAGEQDLTPVVDADVILALAIADAETGRYRAADRLYRLYADLLGPNAGAAAGAFWRLADMYETSGVGWGDPEAERSKARALDPGIEQRIVLPALPDPDTTPALIPYSRPVEPAAGRDHPAEGYGSLPVLIRWTAPQGIDLSSGSLMRRTVDAEILVGEDGRVREVALPPEAAESNVRGEATVAAASEWVFRPATAAGEPVASWITLTVDVPVAAAPDSLGPAEEPMPAAAPVPEGAP